MWSCLVVGGAAVAIWVRWRRSGLPWYDFVILHGARVYAQLWHRWSCRGPGSLPARGPALIIANHTCSADPNFLLACSERPISFLVAREHYAVHRWIERLLNYLQCVAVTRDGRDPIALRQALRRLEQGRMLCLFPEGNLSGVLQDRILQGKHGIGFLALHSRVPVYPVYIAGGPRTIKLLNSWLWPTQKAVRIFLGPAIDLSAYYARPINRQVIEEVSNLLMGHIEALRPANHGSRTRIQNSSSAPRGCPNCG